MSTLLRTVPRASRKISSLAVATSLKRSFRVHPRSLSDIVPILTQNAMPPAGPYSQAIKTSHAIYCSGQIPADAQGNVIEGSMSEKTGACLKALSAVLAEAGSSVDKIVKTQVFLTDLKDFEEMNVAYEKWIQHKPARSCVVVKQLPKGADVEIECVALP